MKGVTEIGDGVGSAVILLLLVIFFKSCRNWWFVLAAALCNIAPALLIQGIKSFVAAPRPLEYYKLEISRDPAWLHIRDHWPRLFHRSFPSGHSGCIFSLCCFISMILPKGWTRAGLVLFFVAIVVAYSRMYLAAHFYLDIFVGSMLGTIGTMFCFALMRRWSNQSFRIVSRRGTLEKPTSL
jgi:membrane-associated phospholipid phosphatase